MQETISLLKKLLSFENINPPGNETPVMEYIASLLEAEGFQVQLQEFAPNRSNLVAYDGAGSGKPKLCFSGHLDVVPLGKVEWSKDPFAGQIAEGKIYGRGVSDMKGGVACILEAAIAAKRNATAPLNICLAFTGAEEAGFDGAKAMVKEQFIQEPIGALIIAEPTSNQPFLGHKGMMWLQGKAKGVTAHGSTPHLGENAVYKAMDAMQRIRTMGFGVASHPLYGEPSINLGWMQGGMNPNSVPDVCEFCLDVRLLPSQTIKEATKQIQEAAGPSIEFTVLHEAHAIETDPEDAWVQDIYQQLTARWGETPAPAGGLYVTDAVHLTPALGNPPTLILGPGESSQAHKTDEFCYLDKLQESKEIFLEMIQKWQNG